jgi:LysM repeat protein
MKRIFVWFLILSSFVAAARAQDDATQQQINKLNGQVQDALDAQAVQAKRIEALEKEIGELRDKSGGSSVAQGDLQKLADQVQELAKKQQADNDLILKEIGKLGKVSGGSAASRKSPPTVSTTGADNPASAGTSPQKGYDYTIQRGDTLLAIAKAYHDQGIKVTTEQILKANPGLDPKNLIVGKKIFIPAPAK